MNQTVMPMRARKAFGNGGAVAGRGGDSSGAGVVVVLLAALVNAPSAGGVELASAPGSRSLNPNPTALNPKP